MLALYANFAGPELVREALRDIMVGLHERYPRATITLAVERNMHMAPYALIDERHNLPYVEQYRGHKDHIGFWTSQSSKSVAYFYAAKKLSKKQVFLSSDIVYPRNVVRPKEQLDLLREQLFSYELDVQVTSDRTIAKPLGDYDLAEAFVFNFGEFKNVKNGRYPWYNKNYFINTVY